MMYIYRHYMITAAILMIVIFLILGCGDSPSTAVEWLGSIEVEGYYYADADTTNPIYPDIINVTIDEEQIGYVSNPFTIENVYAGLHRLTVVSWDSVNSDSVGKLDTIRVNKDELSLTDFKFGPVVIPGFPAPDFSFSDLAGSTISHSDLSGKILLLYFFSWT